MDASTLLGWIITIPTPLNVLSMAGCLERLNIGGFITYVFLLFNISRLYSRYVIQSPNRQLNIPPLIDVESFHNFETTIV